MNFKGLFFLSTLYIIAFVFLTILFMAVPKKRTSKSKKNSRKSVWKKKAVKSTAQALSLAKSIIQAGRQDSKSTSFIYLEQKDS
jgi:large subunit ribosomal protein L32